MTPTYNGQGEYADLDAYGREAAPQHQFAPGLDTVPDGDYDVQFGSVKLDRINNDRVVRSVLHLAGRAIEYLWWLNKQPSVNGFLADMAALGFPAHTWGSRPGQTPLSAAIPGCVATLEGVRFRAVKSSRKTQAKPAQMGQAAQEARTFHELHIHGRLAGAPMPNLGTAPADVPAPQPVGVGAPGPDLSADIPFALGPFIPWVGVALALGGLFA